METRLTPQENVHHKGLYEYLLITHPSNAVYEKVMTEKQAFYNQFGEKLSLYTKPFIKVASFLAKEAMEDTILRYMQRILLQYQGFEVALNNYSGFPPGTIYLRVQNQDPFRQLTRELKVVSEYVSSCSCPSANLTSNAHISIAKQLPEKVYSKAIMHYSQKDFYDTFMVNELMLVRRANQYDSGKTINVFRLQPAEHKHFQNTFNNH